MLAVVLAPPVGLGASQARASTPAGQARVTIAMLPHGTGVEELSAAVPGISPGLLSAGQADVPSAQSYLDVGQGSRLAQSLYPMALPPLYVTGDRVPGRAWSRALERAQDAPAQISPGLLAATLDESGVTVSARPLTGSAALIAVDPDGHILRARGCRPPACPGVTVTAGGLDTLSQLAAAIDPAGDDLLIAIERPPSDRDLLTIGILGGGFGNGDLTSATTRMDGYVLTTDLLPTILARYGIAVPEEVSGRIIETTADEPDPAGLAALEDRLSQVSERRWGVIAVNLLLWAGLVAVAAAVGRRRIAAVGLVLLAVAMAYMPAVLLLSAGLAPSDLVERLMVGLGAPGLAALTLLGARAMWRESSAYGAFSIAAAVSITATALDIVLGSPLTALSLLGPNPALGVRFFGIGNELEATIAALLLLGVGSAVTAIRPPDPARKTALATVVASGLAVLIFAPGRLGADVGAAITFPAGAAATVIVALRLGRRRALLVLAAPLAALMLLVAIDLITGGDAHLSRSVLGAGGLDELGDVFERRISQSAGTFPRYIGSPFFIAALAAVAAGVVWRKRIASWLTGRPAALAGLIGAVAATVVGTLANDSAAVLLMVGAGFIAAFCGLAWAAGPGTDASTARPGASAGMGERPPAPDRVG